LFGYCLFLFIRALLLLLLFLITGLFFTRFFIRWLRLHGWMDGWVRWVD
jgi:uncharacterized membrane protein